MGKTERKWFDQTVLVNQVSELDKNILKALLVAL